MLLLELFQKSSALKMTANTDNSVKATATIGRRDLVFQADLVGDAWGSGVS